MKSIKADTVKKVFLASLDRSSTSRTALSNDTGLSYVTVDRAVEFLLQENILKQSYSSKSAVIERRSRMLSPKLHHWIAVYEILPDRFSFYMVDIALRAFKSFSYKPEDSIFIDDLLRQLISKSCSFAKKFARTESCIGSAILLCGDYDPLTDKASASPIYHLPAVKIKEFFSENGFNSVIDVYSVYSAFAKAQRESITKDEAVYSLFFDKGSLHSSYILPNGTIHIKDLSYLPISSGSTFARVMKMIPDPDLIFPDLCNMLYMLISTIRVTKITVCDMLYSNPDTVCAVIKNIMIEKYSNRIPIPKIEPTDISKDSIRFISREIRNRWFFEKILTDKG